ncbi:MAG: hypothetical protein R3E66_18715 [bacterium]
MRFVRVLAVLLCLTQLGCVTGVRHQWGTDSATRKGVSAQIEGEATMFWGGVVLDVRFLRLVMPQQEFLFDNRIEDERGGRDGQEGRETRRALQLDVPLLSIWTPKNGFGLGYPPLTKMRKGLEIWTTGSLELQDVRWYTAEAGLVYYHAPWVALRLFGGWQSTTYSGATQYIDAVNPIRYEGRTTGPSIGAELTLFSGEYALKVFEWLLAKDEKHRKMYGD